MAVREQLLMQDERCNTPTHKMLYNVSGACGFSGKARLVEFKYKIPSIGTTRKLFSERSILYTQKDLYQVFSSLEPA